MTSQYLAERIDEIIVESFENDIEDKLDFEIRARAQLEELIEELKDRLDEAEIEVNSKKFFFKISDF